jgi:hypothetical protein
VPNHAERLSGTQSVGMETVLCVICPPLRGLVEAETSLACHVVLGRGTRSILQATAPGRFPLGDLELVGHTWPPGQFQIAKSSERTAHRFVVAPKGQGIVAAP